MNGFQVTFLTDVVCQLGEGPMFCDRRETLYWFDILARRRHAFDFKSGVASSQALPEMASAMAVVDEDHDVFFTESGLWLRELPTGCWTPVCAIESDDEHTRSNDARVHPSGAMWLGTMSKTKDAGAGAIYHFRAGTLTKLYGDVTIPNAICFSPDGATAYFTDTVTGRFMMVDINPKDGLPVGKPRVFFHQPKNDVGGIDGAICDADGNIWNARWGSNQLDRYTRFGARAECIRLPVSQPSCPAFVGGNHIAVTSAWEDMDEKARAADPDAGKTILLEFDKPVRARFEPKALLF